MTRSASIVAVTSGKGGVGKTHIAANLGIMLAKQGRRTCLIDADHGLANINLVLGIPATQPPDNLFEPDCDLLNVMIKTDYGVDVLPSFSGISQNTIEGLPDQTQINRLLERLKPHYDVVIIDTSAGIDKNVKHYLQASDHALLVINSEPTSLTDAFGLVRKMKSVQPYFNVIINRVSNAAAATAIYKRFAGAVRKYIGAQLGAIGYISEDSFVSAATLSQTPVVSYSPSCLASQSFKRISRSLSKKILEQQQQSKQDHSEQSEQEPSIDIAGETSTGVDESTSVNQATSKPESLENAPDSQTVLDSESSSPVSNVDDEPIPTQPSFITAGNDSDPFESWLAQIQSFLLPINATEKARLSRKRQLIAELEIICDKDPSLLPELEALVMKNSLKHSNSVMDQANITNRLANTRFVDEPTLGSNYSKASDGVSKKVFSIISKLK
jgi:MinD-like ATPase involved in chromosome partitioning or flagellar assembly